MITNTIIAEEHIIHEFTKDWKSVKDRFHKMMYVLEDATDKLQTKWNKEYGNVEQPIQTKVWPTKNIKNI